MESLLTVDSLISLLTLTLLEIVLGIDNVIFVSILMTDLNKDQQLKARRIWMIAGIIVRSSLLLLIGWLVNNGHKNLFTVFDYSFNIRNVIMFVGGLFLLYKTVQIGHLAYLNRYIEKEYKLVKLLTPRRGGKQSTTAFLPPPR